jgi:hypothetical protein
LQEEGGRDRQYDWLGNRIGVGDGRLGLGYGVGDGRLGYGVGVGRDGWIGLWRCHHDGEQGGQLPELRVRIDDEGRAQGQGRRGHDHVG